MAANKDKIRATAQKLLQKGQIDKAIKEFQRLVADDPKDVRTLLKIGDLQTRAGKHTEATETYSAVAEFYAEQGFFLKAVAVYKQILKIDSSLVEVNLKLAELYHQLGLLSDATNQYRQISQIYEKECRVEEAVDVLRKMVELDPENVASRIKLAEMYAKQNMVEEARDEFRSAAAFLKSHHRIDDYIKVAERIVHFDPTDLETTRELANIYIQKNDARRALAKLQVCFKADPKDVETLSLLANAFRDLGQTQKTISVYRELARIHLEHGDHDAHLAVLRKVLDVAPDDPEAKAALEEARQPQPPSRVQPSQRAMGVQQVHRQDGAVDDGEPDEVELEAAEVEIEEETEEPLADAAETIVRILTEVEVYTKYGLKNKALEHVQRIFEIDPHHREARTKYKDLLLEMRDAAGAARELLLLANLAHAGGEPEQARDHLEELLGVDPTNSQAADLLEQLGVPSTPAAPAPDPLTAVLQDDGVPAVVRQGRGGAQPLDYEPSPAAAEIDLDADEGTFDELMDEPLQIEADDVPSVVSGESELRAPRGRPSELSGARGLDVAKSTSISQSGSTEIDMPAPVDTSVVSAALDEQLDDLLASVPSPRSATVEPAGPPDDEVEPDLVVEVEPMESPSVEPELVEPELVAPTEPDLEEGEPEWVEPELVEPELVEPELVAPTEPDLEEGESEWVEPELVEPASEAAEEPMTTAVAEPESPAAPEPEPDIEDEVEEIRFFVQQGLEDEARDSLEALLLAHPTHPELLALEAQLQTATPPEPEAHIDEAEPEPETLEYDTLDLAAELDAELTGADDDFQVSFTDVFDEFKKGVAQTVEAGDFDTHYNLGIAYKEMGLLEDAVREFDQARGAPDQAIGALTMKGICQLELGQTDSALESFLGGLSSDQVSPEQAMALRYEIGLAYESMGRFGDACKFYEKVCAMDETFRDVRARFQAAQSQTAESEEVSHELDALLDETQAEQRAREDKADKISYV